MLAPIMTNELMSSWYEVYDNVEVQYVTRRQVAKLTGVAIAAGTLTVASFLLAQSFQVPLAITFGLVLALWAAFGGWSARRLRQLRRVVWCIKVSDREVVGYDYARRKLRLDWTDVARVELNDSGLVVAGPDVHSLEVPHLFPDFPSLSHRIVHYAEFYDVPVYVGDQPWQQVDVYDLFPFLQEDSTSDTSHPSRGQANA